MGAVSECEVRSPEWKRIARASLGAGHPTGGPEFSADGSHIVFQSGDTIYSVNMVATQLHRIPDGPASLDYFMKDYSPRFAPDGSRVVYSTYRYSTGFLWNRTHSFEIATSRPDGTDAKRLTSDKHEDSAPAWSPDGARIAFMSVLNGRSYGIYTMKADGSDVTHIVDIDRDRSLGTFGLLIWSPDGRFIAYRGVDTELPDGGYHRLPFIMTVSVDGTGLRRVIEADHWLSHPSWSPDGRHMAVLGTRETGEVVVYTVDTDRWHVREIFVGPSPSGFYRNHLHGIAWTPDGSEIRFYGAVPEFALHAVKPDGTGFRTLLGGLPRDAELSSPGGDRIAVLRLPPEIGQRVVLYTLTVDGPHIYKRDLVRYAYGDLVAENSDWQREVPTCYSGRAVTDPSKNLDLVRDCVTLQGIRDELSGKGVSLNWTAYVPMERWSGVKVGGSPRRVEKVEFSGSLESNTYLSGTIPAEIGELSGLKTLMLDGQQLTGEIPPELGDLVGLERLSLLGNQLTGNIPSELGKLVKLERLVLSRNQLTGSIPPELGDLVDLEWLYLSENELTGQIPVELGQLEKLKNLVIHGTGLTGCVPAELAGNPALEISVGGMESC